MKKTAISLLVIISLIMSAQNLFSQTLEDAAKKYNSAAELSKTDLIGAYNQLKEVSEMCATLGSEADELRNIVVKLLPTWQYNVANTYVRDKDYDKAIAEFKDLANNSSADIDNTIKEKAKSQLSKLLFVKANSFLKQDQTDKAIETFDLLLENDSTYAQAHLWKGQAFKKKGDDAKMLESYLKAKEMAAISNDEKTLNDVNMLLSANYLSDANAAYKAKDYQKAYDLSKIAVDTKNDNLEALYMLAISSNLINKYDDAIDAAKAGAEQAGAEISKNSRFFFEVAKAYEAKGDTANACANYKKSYYGAFEEAAKHKVNVELKCN